MSNIYHAQCPCGYYEREENYTLDMCEVHNEKIYGVTEADCLDCGWKPVLSGSARYVNKTTTKKNKRRSCSRYDGRGTGTSAPYRRGTSFQRQPLGLQTMDGMAEKPGKGWCGMSDIGENIKKMRKKSGITQTELANRVGTTFQSISQWECGKRNPKYSTVVKIAKAIGCKPDEILSPIRTNADKIRKMSNEELAHFLVDYADSQWFLNWLNQEVTE